MVWVHSPKGMPCVGPARPRLIALGAEFQFAILTAHVVFHGDFRDMLSCKWGI